MRVVMIALMSLCVPVLAITAPSPSLPQDACTSWGRAQTVTMRGSSAADGLSGVFTMTQDLGSGRYKAERSFSVFSTADGFDGRLAWTRDHSGASHALDSAPARALAATNLWLRRRGWCTQGGYSTPEPKADEIDAGTTLAVWRVLPRAGVPVLLRFDRATGLLSQSEVRLWEGRLIRHYSDWRDVGGGALIPFTVRDEYPEDESVEIVKLVEVKTSAQRPAAAMFAMPPLPRDYEILGGAVASTVPYEDDGIGRIYAPVYLNGQGPYPFEVDTGGHFILSAATATALHLQAVGAANATGGGTGIVQEGSVRVRELRIADAVIREQPARVIPFSAASNDRGTRLPRAGFLGLEFFERFAVALDRRAKTLTLTPLERYRRPAHGVFLPLRFTEDAPLTSGSFAAEKGDFEVDSGDAGPAIIEGYWAQVHGFNARLSRGLVWSGGGVGGDYHETLSRGDLTMGPIALPHEVVSFVGFAARGSESTRLQAGVIGESSLYRFDMVYDYRRKELWIDPRTNIPVRAFNRAGLRLRKNPPESLQIVLVAQGSAADVAGVKSGDQILAINGRAASELGSAEATSLFEGPIGTEIPLLLVPQTGGPAHVVKIELKELLP